jgi:hypothetical protein
VIETDWRGCQDFHVLSDWRYLGTTQDEATVGEFNSVAGIDFDPDIYRILRRFLDDPGQTRIVELD